MAKKVVVRMERKSGPPTPNFGYVGHLLDTDQTTEIIFDKERMRDHHGGVGVKMSFVCDLLDRIESLDKHPAKVFVEEATWGLNLEVFQEFLRTIDVFVSELYSILDYNGHATNLNSRIRKAVDDLVRQTWFDYFHRLRIRITHRMPVDLSALIVYSQGKITKFDFPFLPDNPDEVKLTFNLQRPLVAEFKKWLEGIFSFVNDVSGGLITLFSTQSS